MFEMRFTPAPIPTLVIAGLMTLMATAIGALTSREVFRATAMDALRE
jgi:hypothetical protein